MSDWDIPQPKKQTEEEKKASIEKAEKKGKEIKKTKKQPVSIFRQLASNFFDLQPFFYTREKHWWLWNKYYWKNVDEVDLMIEFDKHFSIASESTSVKSQILEALKKKGRINEPKPAGEWWIQFKDTIIDIKNNTEFKSSPEYFVTNPIPWKLGDSEETPVIDKLFRDWVVTKGDGDKWVPTLYETCSYSMLADYPIHVAITLLGDGMNGKGTFQRLIERLVGGENYTTMNFSMMAHNQFETWSLYRKLVCLMGEVNMNILKETDTFKRLTGQDTMKFTKKRHDGIEGKNYAKLILSANQLPETYDKSKGFYRRQLIIDFPNEFKDNPKLLDIIPEAEYENLCRKSVRILKELLERGTFTNQGDIAERIKRYEDRSNPFGIFVKECCFKDINYEIPFWKLYSIYGDFLKQRNFRLQSKIEFGKTLRNNGFTLTKPRNIGKKTEEGKQISWVYVLGIQLSPEFWETE